VLTFNKFIPNSDESEWVNIRRLLIITLCPYIKGGQRKNNTVEMWVQIEGTEEPYLFDTFKTKEEAITFIEALNETIRELPPEDTP